MIRFEILLPLFYNDGRPNEPQKFIMTDDDLAAAFGPGMWLRLTRMASAYLA